MITEKTADSGAPAAAVKQVDANGAAAVSTRPNGPSPGGAPAGISPGLIASVAIMALLWFSIGGEMLVAWRGDKALSHGPLVPFIAGALLWIRRDELKSWTSAALPGLVALLGSTFLFVLAVWADVEFVKPLSLIFVLLSGVYFLGGKRNCSAAAGPLGFLVFMIPWPLSLTAMLAFPMQLMSSTYAAAISGLIGLPVERNGVHLRVTDGTLAGNTVYEVVVAQACSGLTSMTVLLALGYLIAYFTPIKLGWRAVLMAAIVPLALICNSIRLSVILLIGGQFHNKPLATWVHDNEGPVLIFFCSILLMAIRAGMMKWLDAQETGEHLPAPQAAEA